MAGGVRDGDGVGLGEAGRVGDAAAVGAGVDVGVPAAVWLLSEVKLVPGQPVASFRRKQLSSARVQPESVVDTMETALMLPDELLPAGITPT